MVNFISKGQRRLTAHSQPCCDLSCSRTRYHRQHHPHYRQTGMPLAPTTPLGFMIPQGLIHHLTSFRPLHFPHRSHPQRLTRIYSRTCHHAIMQTSLAIRHRPGRLKADTARISTQDPRFTAYPQCDSVASKCFSALGGSPELYQKCRTRCWMPLNWQMTFT
jgi:hypothetical protein